MVFSGCIHAAERITSERETSTVTAPYVLVACKITEFYPNFQWSENWINEDGSEVHDDGVAPKVVLHISSPDEYVNRDIAILYKYRGKDALSPPSLSQKGEFFLFELPAEFLAGKYDTIDNIYIRNFRAMP